MDKLNVVVIFGGYSTEHEISKDSAATIIMNMSEEKYNVIPIYITKEGNWLLYDGSKDNIKNVRWDKFGAQVVINPDRDKKSIIRIVGDRTKTIPIDVVFPVLHGKNGEDGTIQGLFEISNIPYVGCNVLTSAIAMDKSFTKIIVNSLDIEQAKHLVIKEEDLENLDEICKKARYEIGYPCFIKPSSAGSSVGISKAKNKKEVIEGLKNAFSYDSKVIIEKNIVGRELECAILGDGAENTIASVVGEVDINQEFYDFDTKYNNPSSKNLIPAKIPAEISDKIQENAIKIFKALDGKGLSRVDFFLEEKTNKIIFNEINTIPGFTKISMYPELFEYMGIDIENLIDKLIDIAIKI